MRAFAYWCALSVATGMFGVCGCSSDSSDDGGGSSGETSTAGNGGTSSNGGSGGTSSSGGHAGTSSNGGSGGTSSNGGSGGTSSNGGSGGTSSNGGSGGAGGAGTTYASTVCDHNACEDCFENSDCHTIDNPCNDDTSCDPRENKWEACVCGANGDATAAAQCDSDFSGMNTDESQPIIDCVKRDCPVCYQAGPTTKINEVGCAVAQDDCSVCVELSCTDELNACEADAGCSADDDDYGQCVCNAQLGNGTIAACAAVDTGLTAINSCVQAHCATECGF